MTAYDDDLRLAHVLADAADSITMSRFKALDLRRRDQARPDAGLRRRQAVEEAIRSTLSRARPRDAVTGEEFGDTGHGPRRWVLDPIDGTKNFVRGVPVWATLIALMDGDDVVAGLRQRARAGPPLVGRRRVRRLDRQEPVVGQPDAGLGGDPARRRVAVLLQPLRLARPRPRGRVPRADPRRVAHPRLRRLLVLHAGRRGRGRRRRRAGGRAATTWPPRRSSSPRPGGRFTDLAGTDGPAGGSAVATNGHLHDEVVRRLTP